MTLEEFKALVSLYKTQKEELERLKLEISAVQENADSTEKTILAAMEELNLSNFSIDGIGTIFVRTKFSVKTPKSPESKEAFYQYLKDIGQFDSLISVNSQTLNAWVNGLKEVSERDGTQFKMPPGLNDFTDYKKAILRR